jgi:hypothetical protein
VVSDRVATANDFTERVGLLLGPFAADEKTTFAVELVQEVEDLREFFGGVFLCIEGERYRFSIRIALPDLVLEWSRRELKPWVAVI